MQNPAFDLLRILETAAKEKYVPPYAFAQIHPGLGDTDLALQFLDPGFEMHDVHLAILPYDPKWDPLRSDPRFPALLDRLLLAETHPARI